MNAQAPRELTTEEAAKALDVSERTIYTLRTSGKISGRRDGGDWLYTLESIRAELMRRRGLA